MRCFQAHGLLTAPFYDAGPDGRLLMVRSEGQTDGEAPPPEINVVLNWFEELKARVPGP